MSLETNRKLVYQVYDAINTQDLARLDELFDPQVFRHAMGEVGNESARKALRDAFAAYPETCFVVEDVLVEGDKAALRVTIHGRPTAPDSELPIIMEIFRIENGRVAEIWGAGMTPRKMA